MTRIAPHSGFTWHPHRGVEIYTWMLEGTLHHEDTTGGQGDIGPGELQRMFSGDWIEHQELNLTGEPVRVIQIWFAADPRFRGLAPHYQQLGRSALPARRSGDATVWSLIGDGSPMEPHVSGRLIATRLAAGGTTALEAPRPGEDLFVYITDGAGTVPHEPHEPHERHEPHETGQALLEPLEQYDVLLARPALPATAIQAGPEAPLDYLSFYLPAFMP
jgi:hypothetical protein